MLAFALVAAVAALALARGGSRADYRGSEPPAGIALPEFALHDYRGRLVTSESLRGDVVLVTFLDSQCTDACPLIARQVTDALALLGREHSARVVPLAITTDPAEDTPAAVRTFLRKHGAERTLSYLVGNEQALRPVWRAFGVLPSVETGKDDMHSAPVRIYDRKGEWVATQHSGADLSAQSLAHDLRLAAASSR